MTAAGLSSITYNLLTSMFWASGTKIFDYFKQHAKVPLKRAINDTQKEFKNKGLPFPISRIETILLNGEPNTEKYFSPLYIQTSEQLAIALLDFEGSSNKEVEENVQNTLAVLDYFKNALERNLLADKNVAPVLFFELQKLYRQATGQEHHEIMQGIKRVEGKLETTFAIRDERLDEIQSEQRELLERASKQEDIIHEMLNQVKALTTNLSTPSTSGTSVSSAGDVAEAAINKEIDTYRDMIKEHPQRALSCYQSLKARCWESATLKTKFRITTNIGTCYLMLCQDSLAIDSFFQALEIEPVNPIALSNAALSFLLKGNKHQAREKAKKALELNPEHENALSHLLASYSENEIIAQYQTLVPPEKQSCPAVAFVVGCAFLRARQFEHACEWLKRAYEQDPGYQNAQYYAISLLELIFNDPAASIGGQIKISDEDRCKEAKEILENCWNQSDHELKRFLVLGGINLFTLYRFLGESKKAEEILEQILSVAPENVPAIEAAAMFYAQCGQIEKAIKLFERLRRGVNPIHDLAYAEALMRADRYPEAATVLDLLKIPNDDHYLIYLFEGLKHKHIEKSEGIPRAIESIDNIIKQFPDNIGLMAFALTALKKFGEKEKIEQLVEDASGKIEQVTDFRETLQLADALFEVDRFDIAIVLYKRVLSGYEFSHTLRMYLSCCLKTEQRVAIEKAFSKMSKKTFNHPQMRRFRGVYYFKAGKVGLAYQEYEWLVSKDPNHLEDILNWLFLLQYRNEDDRIKEYLQTCSDFPSAPPEDRMRLVQYFQLNGLTKRAIMLGYKLIRKFRDNPQIVMKYLWVILQSEEIDELKVPEVVDIDTAVRIKNAFGEIRTIVIEKDKERFFEEEFPPTHPLPKSIMGRRKGDLFEVQAVPIQAQKWEIDGIMSKYIYLAQKFAATFNINFPDNTSFYLMKNPVGIDGKPNLNYIFEVIDRRSAFCRRMYELYAKLNIPIGFFAGALGVKPMQAWIGLLRDPACTIKCCKGVAQERPKAFQTIEKHQGRCVIDPFTLYTAYSLNIHEELKRGLGSIALTESVLSMFREQIDDMHPDREIMYLAKHGEGYSRSVMTPEDIRAAIDFFQGIHDWAAANCEIIPAVGKTDIPPANSLIFSTMHPCFMDILMAASGSDRFLLSDDLSLRSLGGCLCGCEGAWLQIVLEYCLNNDALSFEKYIDSIVHLIESGVSYTCIHSSMLISKASGLKYRIDNKFRTLLSVLGQKETTIQSALNVTQSFFEDLEHEKIGSCEVQQYVFQILNALRAWRSLDIVNKLIRISRNFLNQYYQKLYLEAIHEWTKGHYFNSVQLYPENSNASF